MKSSEPREECVVVEKLPSQQFKVRIGGKVLRCYLAGKMQQHHIRVIEGDRVSVLVSGEIGRIERRL